MTSGQFKILSLDGGGIRGLFPAAFLAHIEEYTQKSLYEHFDLIVGTSTGAIIALGLAYGLPARQILDFYQIHGPKIFTRSVFPFTMRNLFRPKYTNRELIRSLQEIFGNSLLNDLKTPVCIPSYELVTSQPRVFKDDHHKDLHWGGSLPIWKVACASSAAPIFFPSFQIDQVDNHVDGGIWANNPILVGITDAIRYFDRKIDEISVLSVGTCSQSFRLPYRQSKAMGIWKWMKEGRVLEMVLDAQSKAAHNSAKVLLSKDQYLRIDVELSHQIKLDDYHAALDLIEQGKQAARTERNKISQMFLSSYII